MKATFNFVKKIISGLTALATVGTLALTSLGSFGSTFASNQICDEEIDELANEIAILVNEARAEAGLQPLYVVPYLNEISEIRAVETTMEFSHTRNGQKFTSIIDTSIVDYRYAAENLACGNESAEDTFDQWRNSAGHWKNILSPNATHMGIGVVYDENSEYGWYWQQLFVETDQVFEDQYLPADHEIVPKAEGDVNGDGYVDTFDCIELNEYIYKSKNHIPTYLNKAQLETADCFRDGLITEADSKVMVRFLLGEYKSLPFTF